VPKSVPNLITYFQTFDDFTEYHIKIRFGFPFQQPIESVFDLPCLRDFDVGGFDMLKERIL
jgi:hypothetical protein